MRLVSKNTLQNKKILVTGGPTWVRLDAARVISNMSSGLMARDIVHALLEQGAKVTYLAGPAIFGLNRGTKARVVPFLFFEDLEKSLTAELKKPYDAVIHAAAVADYRPQKTIAAKLASGRKEWKITLIPTPKLIRKIKQINPRAYLVGFKLEPGLTEKKAQREAIRLAGTNACDLVVANSVDGGQYRGLVFDPQGRCLKTVRSRPAMARSLTQILAEHFG
ncbi:MAG: phosphopantothenoylcysteine decarboxylase [Candidatus Omnitrophica bacterium]|nr:phosphopantothenoylcysteine decarboxylase [Candidatus Omnitrophota bacterium]